VARDLIIERAGGQGPRLLFVEPYLTASHQAFMHGLMEQVPAHWTALGLPGRHWRWRMRGAASFLAQAAADILDQLWDGLVCSDMLGLAELKGLAPGLAQVPALVVFHENQLAYPAPGRADAQQQGRDLYLALSNLTSAQAAKLVVFNSEFHRRQFLEAAATILGRLPDMRPAGLMEAIAAKSRVLAMPLDPGPAADLIREPRSGPLRILWNHRWSQDKDPEQFFGALKELAEAGQEFALAVLGPVPARPPAIFHAARQALGGRVRQWGFAADRRDYWGWLFWADLVASTARQEYFGLAVAEAVWAGCRPLLPDALVYPEIYPAQYRYPPGGLAAALAPLAADPAQARAGNHRPLVEAFTWQCQAKPWQAVVDRLCLPASAGGG